MAEEDLVYRLRKRAEIRRQITSRKSVQEGKADRISDLLEEAALEIETLRSGNKMNGIYTVVLEEAENGDLIFPLPQALLEGPYPWLEGDQIEMEVKDETIHMVNVSWMHRNQSGFG
jgi:hypothetical protein